MDSVYPTDTEDSLDASILELQRNPIIDIHLHMVGNGYTGSGCILNAAGTRRLMARVMLRTFGLPQHALDGRLEELYVERAVSLLQRSPVRAAVLLAQEFPRDEHGRVIAGGGAMFVPNEVVLSAARQHSELLPGVSIHPARPDAIEELEKCVEGGAVLMKLLPNCQNVDCGDERYVPFWERMAALKLPFLAHTGGELTLPVVTPRYADPSLLRLPLECGVRVIGAHCATSSGLADQDYTEPFAALLSRYPELYGDNSGMITPFRAVHFPKLVKEPIHGRVLYGSDIPVAILPSCLFARGLIRYRDYIEIRRERNPWTRDVLLKLLLGFSNESFWRASEVLRLTESQRKFISTAVRY